MSKIFEIVAADDAIWMNVADENGQMKPYICIIEVKSETSVKRINERIKQVVSSFLAETDLRDLFV